MPAKLRLSRATAILTGTAALVAIGGVAFAAGDGIPGRSGSVKACYDKDAARNRDGGAVLRIYDANRNDEKCRRGDGRLTLEARDGDRGRDRDRGGNNGGGNNGGGGNNQSDLLSGQAFAIAGGTELRTVAPGTWTNVAGLTLALPSAGTYLVSADVRGLIFDDETGDIINCFISSRLATTAGAVANSERVVLVEFDNDPNTAGTNAQATVPIQQVVTVNAATTLLVQASRSTCANIDTVNDSVSIASNADGRSALNYVRIDR